MIDSRVRPRMSVGIAVFLISVVSIVLVAAPMQHVWGMWGMALTELMLLALAIIPVRVLNWNFKDVFVTRVPSLGQVFGVLVLWIASYMSVHATTVSLAYAFSEGMGEVSTGMGDFFRSVPLPVALVIAAVLPAVCEEFLHRGLIQYTFLGKPRWVVILSMSVIFGLFHLDVYRFLGTAILGGVLTYIMLETGNLLLPILLHLVNNAVSITIGFLAGSTTGAVYMPLVAVGSALIIASVVPFLFLGGSRLLLVGQKRKIGPIAKTTWMITIGLSILILMGGVTILMNGETTPLLETSFAQQVNAESRPHEFLFTVERGSNYRLDLAIDSDGFVRPSICL